MNKAVFRDYDRAALDAQYDNRAKVPDFQAYLDLWTARSNFARERYACELGVPYGFSQDETLDIFPAEGSWPAPVQLFFHGGYWTKLSKNEFSFIANAFVPRGITTVVVDYALIPSVDMDELVRQCRAALVWVWRNISRYGGDPERIQVAGHSAGGHLAAMLMATNWPAVDAGLPQNPICDAVGISGLYDLEPIRHCFLNQTLALSPDSAIRNSPAALVRACISPMLLAVGGDEGAEYLRQSQTLSEAWADGLDPPRIQVMEGAHHFSIMSQLEDRDAPLSQAMRAQIGCG